MSGRPKRLTWDPCRSRRGAAAGALLLLATLLSALLGAGTAFAAPPAAGSAAARPAGIVVVGVPGLRWSDVSKRVTPHLWRLAGHGAVGALSVRAASAVTCPLDGWVTLGAGNRAEAPRPGAGRCPPRAALLAEPLPRLMDRIAAANRSLLFDAQIGALGAALHAHDRCAAATGPAAAVAAADPHGRVVRVADPAQPATYRRCAVTVVGVDAFLTGSDRRRAAAAADRVLGRVMAARPPGSQLLVAGLSDTPADPAADLHVLVAQGGGLDGGELVSPSTRRAPYVQLIDLAPTILAELGVDRPVAMDGQPIRATGGRAASLPAEVAHLRDLQVEARVGHGAIGPFFAVLVGGQAVVYLLAALLLWRAREDRARARVRTATRAVAVVAEAGLVASYLATLVPWWRAGHPLAALFGAVAAIAVVIGAVALAGPWRRHLVGPPAVVAAVTFAVIAADLCVGGPLQMDSVAGYSPLVAGRFAGIGNVAFGVFATAALLTGGALAVAVPRRWAAVPVLAVGGAAVVIDGAPALGSDFGGVLSLLPAVALLAMMVGGVRITWRRVVVVLVAAGAVVTAFALVDYARPAAHRTHLGRFVAQVLDGRAGVVVHRKLVSNFALLTHNAATVLLPLALALVIWLLVRPPVPGLRAAFAGCRELHQSLVAILVMSLLGFAVNDSGAAIPALAMTVAVPFTIAAAAMAGRRPAAARRHAVPPAGRTSGVV